jgi:hypothetical protein
MRSISALVVGFAALVLAIMPAARAGQDIQERRAGVEVIRSPAEPAVRVYSRRARERWRVGDDEENEKFLFGFLTDLALDKTGFVYLLDKQLSEVFVFTLGGKLVRRFGGAGEGPGEFQDPSSLFFTPSGRLCVVQPSAHRYSLLSTTGEYLGELPVPVPSGVSHWALHSPRCEAGMMFWQSVETRYTDGAMLQTMRVIRTDEEGNEICEFARAERSMDFAHPVIRDWETNPFLWCVDRTGRVYVNPGYEYEIEHWSPDGNLIHVTVRDFARQRRTSAEMEAIRDYYMGGGGMQDVELEISEYKRDIDWMDVRDWIGPAVHTSTSDLAEEDAGFGSLDQFAGHNGKYSYRHHILGVDIDWKKDRATLHDHRLFVLKNYTDAVRIRQARLRSGEDEASSEDEANPQPMYVICYEFDRIKKWGSFY